MQAFPHAGLWHKHHVFRHHSFTGDLARDPDTIHLTPFLRKHKGSKSPVLGFAKAAPKQATFLLVNVLPGMFLGDAPHSRCLRGHSRRKVMPALATVALPAAPARCSHHPRRLALADGPCQARVRHQGRGQGLPSRA